VTPNQALQQTAGHDSFLGLQALRRPAVAELTSEVIRQEVFKNFSGRFHGKFAQFDISWGRV
jgi:hypothetical protein